MTFYRRLIARSKPPKVALIAAVRKLFRRDLLSRQKSSALRSLPQPSTIADAEAQPCLLKSLLETTVSMLKVKVSYFAERGSSLAMHKARLARGVHYGWAASLIGERSATEKQR
jgi:hypothetical protein